MKKLLTIEQASEFTGLAKQTIYFLCSKRKMPHVKVLSKLRFDEEALSKWIESKTEVRDVL